MFVDVLGGANVISRDVKTIGRELDIYLPGLRFAVEYGSWHWHKDRLNDDKDKANLCRSADITLVSILDNCPADFEDSDFWCYHSKIERDDSLLHEIMRRLLKSCDMEEKFEFLDFASIEKRAKQSSSNITTNEFKEKLLKVNSNIEVLGEYVDSKTHIEVKCMVCGNIWFSAPNNLLHGHGCPACKAEKFRKSSSKAVQCIETGIVYESISAASEATGCGTKSISWCCRGEKSSAGGYHWKYMKKDDDTNEHYSC
jgi:hypothetical protein